MSGPFEGLAVCLLIGPLRVVEHPGTVSAEVEVAGDPAGMKFGLGLESLENGIDPLALPLRIRAIKLNGHDDDASRMWRVVPNAAAVQPVMNRSPPLDPRNGAVDLVDP